MEQAWGLHEMLGMVITVVVLVGILWIHEALK